MFKEEIKFTPLENELTGDEEKDLAFKKDLEKATELVNKTKEKEQKENEEFLQKYDLIDIFKEYENKMDIRNKKEIIKKLKDFAGKREKNVEYDLLKDGLKEYTIKALEEFKEVA